MDRRAARTQHRLQQALHDLTLESGYDAISIQTICNQANVGRSTFYAHYKSKDDLNRGGLDRLRRHLTAYQTMALSGEACKTGGRFSFSLAMLEHAHDNARLYQALSKDGGGTLALCLIREILCDLVRREIGSADRHNAGDRQHREMAVQYVVGAFMAVMVWWLDTSAPMTPLQVDTLFGRLTARVLGDD